MIDGAFVGTIAGIGLLLVWLSFWEGSAPRVRRTGPVSAWLEQVRDDLVAVGLGTLPAAAVPAISLGAGAGMLIIIWSISGALIPAAAIGAVISLVPPLVLRSLARARRSALRDAWPEVVDHLTSAIRAGMSLPEALGQLGEHGPEQLRPQFSEFARDYQASGSFASSLDRLKDRLADPVADRIVEALRITRDVGGTDLGVLLRTLSAFLREDARTRAELEARQSWTVNASRLALAAPWIVLALMSTRPQAAQAYDTPAGLLVIIVAAVVSVIAYRVMLAIARLPQDERVLR
ncbi:type II secretion system F family protein [Brachybacterium sp. JHP9]|uniref:Type II secretion system F family protein n=1 Tax=Brachybacterium equifaecis TaxID=2910770 RepID=A0ABT0R383_9MICO|nr:type II secretion system F family protein [Brachybacterium equifaecis]MCL6423918.1 type II secretion system F family protein [Brachybacterium equifaecis]